MEEGKYAVYIQVTDPEKTAFSYVDLIFIDDLPYAVFKWEVSEYGQDTPSVKVPLDVRYLHPLAGWDNATHMYEYPVDAPPGVLPGQTQARP